jgi:hypothetical protein
MVAATIECSRGSKPEAVQAAAAELDGLTADLAARGGVAELVAVIEARLTAGGAHLPAQ